VVAGVWAGVLCGAGWPVRLMAQPEPAALRLEARVRLTSVRGPDFRVDGALVGLDADSIRLRRPWGERVAWARHEVAALEVSDGLRDRDAERETAGTVGALVAFSVTTLRIANGRPLEGPTLVVGLLFGLLSMPIGEVVGGLLALPLGEDERWRPQMLPADSLRLDPRTPIDEAAALADARRRVFSPGLRLRATRRRDASTVVGAVTALDDALVLTDDDARVIRMPWDDLARVERSRGRPFVLLRAIHGARAEEFRPMLLP
jgi:hypothetical protein